MLQWQITLAIILGTSLEIDAQTAQKALHIVQHATRKMSVNCRGRQAFVVYLHKLTDRQTD